MTRQELTDKELDALAARIMKLPGIDSSHESFVQLEDDGGEVFLKFMSDGGVTDNKNGYTLNALFLEDNYLVDFYDDRKFILDMEDLETFLRDMKV